MSIASRLRRTMGMLPWLREDPDNRAVLAPNNATTRRLARDEHLLLEHVKRKGLPSSLVILRAKEPSSRRSRAAFWVDRINESRAIARREPSPHYECLRQWANRDRGPYSYRPSSFDEELERLLELAARAAWMANAHRSGSLIHVRQAEALAKQLMQHASYFASRWHPYNTMMP